MSIASNSVITWADFSTRCLAALKNVCCNIGGFASNVPTRLRSGQSQVAVYTQTRSRPSGASGGTIVSSVYYANPSNLISTVTEATVNSEWTTFLAAAGIDARSDTVIQMENMGQAIGLYQQFMSYHLKPIYSRRQIYNTLETNPGVFQGTKYIAGTCTPKYTVNPIQPNNVPGFISDAGIRKVVREGIVHDGVNYGLIDRENNPVNHRCYLS
ncbi:MAG: hypothetical protein J5691_00540 [Bacilli bacterium]|nr:hypothetical protein [Bacilli bacterium]